MSPDDSFFTFERVLLVSSDSSDSESLFEVDVKNSENQTGHEWDVIEKTLYQEPGPQITDQELLKECKLWRETFPHFRVRGTKIDVKKTDVVETDQSIQTVNGHFDLNKLNEKRESIKKKVVGELVGRLITKFSLPKEAEGKPSTVEITEIQDDDLENDCPKVIINSPPKEKVSKEVRKNVKVAINTEKESYFERGKPRTAEVSGGLGLTKEQAQKGLLEILNSREKSGDFKRYKTLPKLPGSNGGRPGFIEHRNFELKNFDKPPGGKSKPKTNVLPSNSLTNMFKPFKMVSKIDKKYEGLLEQIMERKINDPNRSKHCRTSASGIDRKSCEDSLEKLRMESGLSFRKNLPKINKFSNNWLNRGEINGYDELEERTNSIRSKKLSKELDLLREERSGANIDEFIENIRQELMSNSKRPPRKSGVGEGVGLRRPKPFKLDERVERSAKSWSCGDLPKKGKKETKSRQMKSGFEKPNESNFKGRSKPTHLGNNRGGKVSGNKNTVLPPIESDEDELECELEANLTELIRIFKSKWPVEQWKRFGLFSDDYLLKINIYWLKFPPPSPASHYILGALYAVIMIIGIIGNFLIIIMFLRKRSFRTPSNIFIMNLAVSDALLLLKMPLFIFNSMYLGPVLGNVGCSIYGFVGGLTGTVSIMTLAAIAFDRYQVIVHPLNRKTRIMIYVQILLIWLYGIFFSTIPLLDIGLNKYVPEGYLTACSFDYLTKDLGSRITIFVFFVAAWVVPLSIIIGSYAAMYRAIFKGLRGRINKLSRHCKEIEMRRTELKVAVMVISVISLWTLSWTPYAVVALMGVTGNEKYLTPISSMIPALFCKTASCIDPYVYAITNPRFRNELKRDLQRSSKTQASMKTTERKEFWTAAEETERVRPLHRGSVDEIIVLATSLRHNF